MSDSREVSGHGLRPKGEIWDAPTDLAEQLIRQGVAEAVGKDPVKPQTKASLKEI